VTRYLIPIALLAAASSGCSAPDTRTIAVIGATAVLSDRAVPDAVVVVKGSRILRVGTRAETPIPAGSEKYDATGKFVVADKSQGGELRPGNRADLVIAAADKGLPAEKTIRAGRWVNQ
jgi:imidazolonepropionase-like amidohydrolase